MYIIEGLFAGKKVRWEFETLNQIDIIFNFENYRDLVDIDMEKTSSDALRTIYPEAPKDEFDNVTTV